MLRLTQKNMWVSLTVVPDHPKLLQRASHSYAITRILRLLNAQPWPAHETSTGWTTMTLGLMEVLQKVMGMTQTMKTTRSMGTNHSALRTMRMMDLLHQNESSVASQRPLRTSPATRGNPRPKIPKSRFGNPIPLTGLNKRCAKGKCRTQGSTLHKHQNLKVQPLEVSQHEF
jgi:hypothetical protein